MGAPHDIVEAAKIIHDLQDKVEALTKRLDTLEHRTRNVPDKEVEFWNRMVAMSYDDF